MIDWKEYLDYYGAEYNRAGGYKVTAKVSRGTPEVHWFSMYIDFEDDNGVKYSYNINSPLGGEGAKNLAEYIMLNFDPALIPPLKNPEPAIETYEDGATFKLPQKDKHGDRYIRVDGKRYSFIRSFNQIAYLDYLILNLEKKVKMKKIDKSELIELGKKEWDNFNLHIPQFEKIYNKFDTIQNVKLQLQSSHTYFQHYQEIENKINEYTGTIIKEAFFGYENGDNDFSKEEQRIANDIIQYLPNKGLTHNTKDVKLSSDAKTKQVGKTKKGLKWWEWVIAISFLLIMLSAIF